MKSLIYALLFFTVLSPVLTLAQGVALKAGDKAPDFTAKDQDGKDVSLKKFKGKKVLLYFYPKDNSAGCTAQACSLRDNISELSKTGYTVLGVSTDDDASHRSFKKSNNLPFSLIADTDKSLHQKYGVWKQRKGQGLQTFGTVRTTFMIAENGVISKVIENIDTKNHGLQVLGFK